MIQISWPSPQPRVWMLESESCARAIWRERLADRDTWLIAVRYDMVLATTTHILGCDTYSSALDDSVGSGRRLPRIAGNRNHGDEIEV